MQWRFGPFRLDLANACLWRGEQRLTLRPKTFDILVYLIEHAGELVTKEDLFDTVWPDTVVADGVLTTSLGELRKVLGETARQPSFIATVHRRGYRFIGQVSAENLGEMADPPSAPHASSASPTAPEGQAFSHPQPALIDRDLELAQLHQWFALADQGARQVVLISGEAGIGKTALVDAFLDQLTAQAPVWIGRGQCIDLYGAGEPYLPLLDALGNLGQAEAGTQVVETLRQYAPNWLLQLPALLSADEAEGLQRRVQGATQERMLRELAEAVEALTVQRPLVLVLEDLHWSDASTLDWLAYMARRRARTRLVLLGAYRPVDAMVRDHPVRAVTQELRMHGQCADLALDYLSEAGVAAYLTRRSALDALPAGLASRLHQRTNGNPLFLIAMVDALVRQGVFPIGAASWEAAEALRAAEISVPEGLRQLVTQQLERLDPAEQDLLEAASVAGKEFSAAAVAVCLDSDVEVVEVHCLALARRGQFIQDCGAEIWPDRTVSARFAFIHDLYREVAYERAPVNRRMRLHLQLGGRMEASYGPQASSIAAELAEHFVRASDAPRAVQYLHNAAGQALQRGAHQETIAYLTRALEWLPALPEGVERTQRELTLQLALGNALIATKGFTPEVGSVYGRAWELSQQIEEAPQRFPALRGVWAMHFQRGELQIAHQHGQTFLDLAETQGDPAVLLEAHRMLGCTLLCQGELSLARTHIENGIALYDATHHHAHALLYAQDPGVSCLIYAAWILWGLGYPDLALQRNHQAINLAEELSHPYSLAWARSFAATLYQLRREEQQALEHIEASLTLCQQYGFSFRSVRGAILRGWSLVTQNYRQEGMAQIDQGLVAYRETGLQLGLPYYLAMQAESYSKIREPDRALTIVDVALATIHITGERWWHAELHRLKGENLLARPTPDSVEAEAQFHQALTIANSQRAKSWELRARHQPSPPLASPGQTPRGARPARARAPLVHGRI